MGCMHDKSVESRDSSLIRLPLIIASAEKWWKQTHIALEFNLFSGRHTQRTWRRMT